MSPGNVGNVFNVAPSGITEWNPRSFGTPVRVLDVRGDDVLGEMLCVSIQQESVINSNTVTPDGLDDFLPLPGPCVGVAEFGAGAGLSTFEFDIDVPRFFPGNLRVQLGGNAVVRPMRGTRRNNGVLLTLPASSLRVLVRNDASVPFPIGSNGVAPEPAENTPVPFNYHGTDPSQVAVVRVHSTYGRRPTQSALTRSFPICMDNVTLPFASNDQVDINIPTYAKRVWFPRFPLHSTTLSVILRSSQLSGVGAGVIFATGEYDIAAGSQGPIELHPYDNILRVQNTTSPAANITDLMIMFELGI